MYFIDSPVIVSATASGFANDSTMHMLNFVVTINGTTPYVFSAEAENTNTISIDISSALRSYYLKMRKYPVVSTGLNETSIPRYQFEVKYYISQFRGGEMQEGSKIDLITDEATAGKLTELERANNIQPTLRSTKPTNGERYPAGHVSISAVRGTNSFPIDCEYLKTKRTTATDDADMVEFLFINQRGMVEDICCVTRKQLSHSHKERNTYSNVSLPSNIVPSIRNTRSKIRPTWKLSSGYVSREWAEWFSAELLASEQVWINLGTPSTPNYQPCVLTPDNDSTIIYDEGSPSALHVDFTCELALDGRV